MFALVNLLNAILIFNKNIRITRKCGHNIASPDKSTLK